MEDFFQIVQRNEDYIIKTVLNEAQNEEDYFDFGINCFWNYLIWELQFEITHRVCVFHFII